MNSQSTPTNDDIKSQTNSKSKAKDKSNAKAKTQKKSQIIWKNFAAAFHNPKTRANKICEIVIWTLIGISIVLLLVELIIYKHTETPAWVTITDKTILYLFAVELLMRIVTYKPPATDIFHHSPIRKISAHLFGRLLYLFQPLLLLDFLVLITFLPFLRTLRVLRLLRLARGIKLFRYSSPFVGIVRTFQENALLYIVTFCFLAVVVLLGGGTFYLVEASSNPGVNTLSDGIWWALVTLTTVGYGDIIPATVPLGRVIAGVIMLLGMFTLALFAGIVGSTLLRVLFNLKQDQFRMSNYVNHIVICGYEQAATSLAHSILAEVNSRETEVVIFCEHDRPADLPAEIRWVMGNPAKESELEKIRLSYARGVIVVGDRQAPPTTADATTIMTIFTLRSYLAKITKKNTRKAPLYIVAEIFDSENVGHAQTAGANEVIETTKLGFSLMAHSAIFPGSASVLSSVASVGDHSLFIEPNPLKEPHTFRDLAEILHTDYSAIVLGIRSAKSSQIKIDPAADTEVTSDSEIVYLAKKPMFSTT